MIKGICSKAFVSSLEFITSSCCEEKVTIRNAPIIATAQPKRFSAFTFSFRKMAARKQLAKDKEAEVKIYIIIVNFINC